MTGARQAMLAGLCVLATSACAPVPKALRLAPADATVPTRVWPPAPEIPRYRYAGELVGEQNFAAADPGGLSAGARLWQWLTGLEADAPRARTLLRPQSGAVDARGRVVVSDSGRGAVFVFDRKELLIWELAGRGTRFRTPVGVAPLADGSLLVADADLARVVHLGADGAPLGSFGHDELVRPTGLARDDAGRVYVADSGAHRVVVFAPDGRRLARIGQRGAGNGEFNGPTHLAIAGGRLYVADTLNARVQSLSLDGQWLHSYGRRGLYVGNLTRPKGVALDRAGNLYIVESYFEHLLVFDGDGRFLLPIAGTGSSPGSFMLPAGVWSGPDGRIFLADMFNARVVVLERLAEGP